jgi:sugar lactone lactonase YvrE
MLRKIGFILTLVALSLLGALAVAAQDDTMFMGSELNDPRHLFLAPDGTLYIAEAGSAGDENVTNVFDAPVKAALTGQVTAVTPDGEQSIVVPELISMDNGFGQIEGPMSVYVTDESYWVVLGMGPVGETPFEGKASAAVIAVDRMSGEITQTIDLYAFEQENNPDGAEEIVANPSDIAVSEDGTLYIVDASANALLTWTEADGLALFGAWLPVEGEAQSVPSTVALGPDGDVYVGFLSGFPFAPETARIERWSADGELKETYGGLTLVTDVMVAEDGTIYAVQMASGFGDAGFLADSGSVVIVTADGIEAVAEEINVPYGMAMGEDGTIYVTVDSAFAGPGAGAVLAIGM